MDKDIEANMKLLIESKSELISSRKKPEPIVLSTRIRVARNLEQFYFPGWAKEDMRARIFDVCVKALTKQTAFEGGHVFDFGEISTLEKQVLIERHLISPELAKEGKGSGVIVNKDQSLSVMINEEDHLRIQVVRSGYRFKPAWKELNELDNALDEALDYSFSPDLGYLTACPTNLGTGMRASVMMHLPGLVIAGQMEKVIRACAQLNLAVRGIYGEGTEATGSIFQISNQQTLGESEDGIIKRLGKVLDTVIEHEVNARRQLIAQEPTKIFDKIGRAFGILRNGYFINSTEALNLLSLMRLGIDFNIVPDKHRRLVDRLFIESQPGHIQYFAEDPDDAEVRDVYRADLFRDNFRNMGLLDFSNVIA